MNFEIIETERLILKGISDEVMKEIFDTLPQDEIKKILGHQSDEDFEKERQKHVQGYASYRSKFIMFLLVSKSTGNIIGRCGIHNWNKEHNRGEIGYNITLENEKRKGLMTEAATAVLKYGFETMKLHRIEALVGPFNVPSLKIIDKLGFQQEGVFRGHWVVDGKYEDTHAFSILKDEYFGRKANQEVK